MSVGWAVLIALAPAIAVACWGAVTLWREQRECDRLNAANAAAWETWRSLTDEDRVWLRANGATEPSLIYWEMR